MTHRSAHTILEEMLEGRGRGEIRQDRITANREKNWLLALTLHSIDKAAEGKPLSDLEEELVTAFRNSGYDNEEIAEQAQLWRNLPADKRQAMFPEKFAALSSDDSYTLEDLKNDAEGIATTTSNLPITTTLNVDAIAEGRMSLRDFPLPRNRVIRQHGAHHLVATAEAAPAAAAPAAAAEPKKYRIKAKKFKCIDRDSDAKLGPSNEVFWIFGALSGEEAVTTNTGVYGDVDNGETFYFSSNEGCLFSTNCTWEPLPDGDIGVLAMLWEHDEGDIERTRKGVETAFRGAAVVLVALGVTAWIGAVTAAVGEVIVWLLGYSDDDHIATETIVFNRNTIESLVPDVRGGKWELTRKFANNDANYDLTIVVDRPGRF